MVDILLESTITTDKGMIILPPTKLLDEQKSKISMIVTNHLDSFSKQLENTKTGKVLNYSNLALILNT